MATAFWIWLRLREILSIKLLLVKGNSENTLKSRLLILMPLEWRLLISICIFFSIYVYSFFFDIINLAPMNTSLGCYELGGVWVCVFVCGGGVGVCVGGCLAGVGVGVCVCVGGYVCGVVGVVCVWGGGGGCVCVCVWVHGCLWFGDGIYLENVLWFETSLLHSVIEDCSGRSTQVPFLWKWVIDGFEVGIGQKIFWLNFGQFDPFPVGVTQGSSGGQIFKMLQMTFHVHQITREVIRIRRIYSLLCVGWMVREILTKGHPKVKWGQIFNNIRFAWMIYQIIPLALHIRKISTFELFKLSLLK